MNSANQNIKIKVIDFLEKLKENKFSIGLESYVLVLQVVEHFFEGENPTDLLQLSGYLAPIVCKSEDEQREFNKLYVNEFIRKELHINEQEIQKINQKIIEIENKKRRCKQIITFASILLASLVLLGSYFVCKKITYRPELNFQTITSSTIKPVFSLGDSIKVSIDRVFKNRKDIADFQITAFLFSNKTQIKNYTESLPLNRLAKDTLAVHFKSKKYQFDTTVFDKQIFVYPLIEASIERNKAKIFKGDEIEFSLIKKDINLPFKWKIIDSSKNITSKSAWNNQNSIKFRFDKTADYAIEVTFDNTKDSVLSKFESDFFVVNDFFSVFDDDIHLVSESEAIPITYQYAINNLWPFLLTLLALVCLVLLFFIKKKIEQIKAQSKLQIPCETEKTEGRNPPYEIPFKSKEHQIFKLNQIERLASELKKTVESPISELDFDKTILATIEKGGLISPILKNKHTNIAYLFLVDYEYSNSQQFKLFSYLIRLFIKKAVNIDFYFYYQNPDLFYQKENEIGLTVQQLADNYYNANLLVISSGYSFLDFYKPIVKQDYANNFSVWQNRILITPTAFNDWSGNEKQLSTFFQLVPADIVGLMEIVKLLGENEAKKNIFSQKHFDTYHSKYVDFNDFNSLSSYLNNDYDLIQWLCGIAIYPKINWHVTMEIGKCILVEKSYKINYENLLKFSRIKWMQEGKFTAKVRLLLLKKLSIENELKARATLLKMLDESDLGEDSFSFEEKLVNKYTQSFVLFAASEANKAVFKSIYDKTDEIKAYAEKFICLYEKKKFLDVSFKIYFEKNDKNESWETPVKNNFGIDEYIKINNENKNELINENIKKELKVWKNLQIFLSALTIIFLLGLSSLFIFKDKIVNLSYNNTFKFINKTQKIFTTPNLFLVPSDCSKKILFKPKKDSSVNNLRDSIFVSFEQELKRGTFSFDALNDTITLPYKINSGEEMLITLNYGLQTFTTTIIPNNLNNYYLRLEGTECLETELSEPSLTIYYNKGQEDELKRISNYLPAEIGKRNILTKKNIEKSVYYFDKKYAKLAERYADDLTNAFNFKVLNNESVGAKFIDSTIYDFNTLPLVGLDMPKSKDIDWEKATLPSSLTEIWAGNKYNMLLTINLSKKALYYSSGDKTTYGTYNIYEVMNKNGVYRILGKTTSGYNVFYLKNISESTISFLYCPNFYKTKEDAYDSNNDFCTFFHQMKLSVASDVKSNRYYYFNNKFSGIKGNEYLKISNGEYDNVDLYRNRFLPSPNSSHLISFVSSIDKTKNIKEIESLIQNKKYLSNPFDRPFIELNFTKGIIKENEDYLNNKIVQTALGEVGNSENPPKSNKTKYGEWYGLNGQPWSTIFVSWVYNKSKVSLGNNPKGFASYESLRAYGVQNNLITNNPSPGDIFILSDKVFKFSHGGIFVKWINKEKGSYETIEGNSSKDGSNDGHSVISGVRNINDINTIFVHSR